MIVPIIFFSTSDCAKALLNTRSPQTYLKISSLAGSLELIVFCWTCRFESVSFCIRQHEQFSFALLLYDRLKAGVFFYAWNYHGPVPHTCGNGNSRRWGLLLFRGGAAGSSSGDTFIY